MKRRRCIMYLLLMVTANSFAQAPEIMKVKRSDLQDFIEKEEYMLPNFVNAKVYFNSGDSAGGLLNYNYFLQTIQFIDQKNDTLALTDEKNLSYITIGADTVFYDNGYYELIASSPTSRLAVRRTLENSGPQKIGAYGIASSTAKIESQDEIRGPHTQKLEIAEEYTFTKQKIYYISAMKKRFVEANKKNISRLFPKKDVDSYVKENNLNLYHEKDLVKLFNFLNTPA